MTPDTMIIIHTICVRRLRKVWLCACVPWSVVVVVVVVVVMFELFLRWNGVVFIPVVVDVVTDIGVDAANIGVAVAGILASSRIAEDAIDTITIAIDITTVEIILVVFYARSIFLREKLDTRSMKNIYVRGNNTIWSPGYQKFTKRSILLYHKTIFTLPMLLMLVVSMRLFDVSTLLSFPCVGFYGKVKTN